jgi:hypothetical protein
MFLKFTQKFPTLFNQLQTYQRDMPNKGFKGYHIIRQKKKQIEKV